MDEALSVNRSEDTPKLEYGNVRFSEERVEALDRGHPVLRIARREIDHVALQWGLQAARPLVQAAIGLVFVSTGGSRRGRDKIGGQRRLCSPGRMLALEDRTIAG